MAAMRPSSVALALHFDQPRLPHSDAQDLHRRPNGTVAAKLHFIKFCDAVPLNARGLRTRADSSVAMSYEDQAKCGVFFAGHLAHS